VREGRFIWCKDLEYKGLSENGLRQISFSVDKGKKRFTVEENNMLCIPSKSFVNNNKYFRSKEKVFKGFSSVLSYDSAINMMARWSKTTQQNICDQINRDNPFKPGTLVAPRLGYFYPMTANPHLEHPPLSETHPYGIILGKSFTNNSEIGREFYRVRFGTITYEAVHPVQMEIINEV
jgi:hypothetical protein